MRGAKMTQRGLLFVLSGPSGVGKGTICKSLIKRNPDLRLSVSCTTRKCRPGEIEGVHYYFKTREQFEEMIKNKELIEYVKVFGADYYGTPRDFVERELIGGHDMILEIDVNGALRVKETYPEAILVFIAPPSINEARRRLLRRGTEAPEAVEKRLNTAIKEMTAAPSYDYVVVNETLCKAVDNVEAIIKAERSRADRCGNAINFNQEGVN